MTMYASLDAAREAYERIRRSDWRSTPRVDIYEAAHQYIEALEAALAAQVERSRVLSYERGLLLRYARVMYERMELEGLSTIAMMQMKAMLDKDDADHAD